MVLQSKSEGAGARFGEYVEELREFFRSRDVRFGSPGDLVSFAKRVGEAGPFQDEMGSMLRSILFQESESLSHTALLEVLTTAVGGSAVETGSPDVQAAVRQIFVFVHDAVRQQSRMFRPESPMDDEEVTAGDVLAASTAQERTGGRTDVGRSPENGPYARGMAPPESPRAAVGGRDTLRGAPLRDGALFRAVSMSDDDVADAGLRQWRGERRQWLTPAILAAVIALVVAGYLARPFLDRAGRTGVVTPTVAQTIPVLAPGSCTASAASGVARSSLTQRAMWAHRLLEQSLYSAALPELKSIAQADPGYPGVYLDESDALLRLKRPEDAREAVDTQIGISECLAKLPSAALDGYCNAEFSSVASETCRPELARIREAAQLQAAMVHLELGHRFESAGPAIIPQAPKETSPAPVRASSGSARPRRVSPLPPASEDDNALPVQPTVASKLHHKSQTDDPLMRGEGTDLSLGAYSKPH